MFSRQAFQSHELSIPTILSTIYLNQVGLEVILREMSLENCVSLYGKNSSEQIPWSKMRTICQLNGEKHGEWPYEIVLKPELEHADHF